MVIPCRSYSAGFGSDVRLVWLPSVNGKPGVILYAVWTVRRTAHIKSVDVMNCVYYDVEGKKSFIRLCNSNNKSFYSYVNLYTNKGEKAVEINPGFWYTIIMYPYARGAGFAVVSRLPSVSTDPQVLRQVY